MKELAELFGGIDNVLVMKEFIDNPRTIMTNRMVADATKADGRSVRAAIATLVRAGLVVEASSRHTASPRSSKKMKERGSSVDRDDRQWRLNTSATYLKALEQLLKPASTVTDETLGDRFAKIGRVQMLVLSGLFIDGDMSSDIDILIVAERADEQKVTTVIEAFEQELGSELSYMLLTSDEYEYRKELRDKTLRELFAHPHRVIINKLGRI